MATVTEYWHKGGGWWTVRVNDQRATVRGKTAAAAAAAVMRQTEQTETDTGTNYAIRSGDAMTGDMVTVTLTREQWQRVTLALGDAVRVHIIEAWGPGNAIHRERSLRHADAGQAVLDIIADTLTGTE